MSDLRIELDQPAQKAGVNNAMLAWEIEAKRICNKKSYSMRDSIGFNVESTPNGYKATIGTFGQLRKAKNFHYPFAVHDGVPSAKSSIRRKGNPFFDISYASKKDEMNRRILKGMKLK